MTRRADGDHARRYLLGELPEAERDVFEEEYFSRDETLGALEAAEDDLIDAYCRDALSPEHRQAWRRGERGPPATLSGRASSARRPSPR